MATIFSGILPTKVHTYDAGYDLRAEHGVTIVPGDTATIPTGTLIDLEPGTVALVAPRSGLATKHGVTVANSPGIIDAGYRDQIYVTLRNEGHLPYRVSAGDRIAQVIVMPICLPAVDESGHVIGPVSEVERGAGGYGSSGR